MVGILLFVAMVVGSFWVGRDWRKCHSCGEKFRSAYLGRWRGRGPLQGYNHISCGSCRKKQREAHEAEITKKRDELKRIANDPAVPVRQRLEARYKLTRK